MRVLLDTNLLISYLLPSARSETVAMIIASAVAGAYTLLLPEELVTEFTDKVRNRQYLAQRITAQRAEALMESLSAIAEVLPRFSEPIPAVARDPKDDYLLASSLLGGADYLVTGDRDLLVIGEVEGLKIVSPSTFVLVLDEAR